MSSRPNDRPRVLAYYLPQFHPVPENDAWWGKGFTEWTNVAKAKPRFPGHYQPHIPADLGFYDLRVPEVRIQQADLARAYGIDGFCYYHYWFAGHRLLERPFEEVVASRSPNFPFCVCWANESWTGVWHGEPGRVLVEQTYPGRRDHAAHFDALLPAFRDPRYVRVDGKPLFLVYVPQKLPDPVGTLEFWRSLAARAGLGGLHVVAVLWSLDWDFRARGFDAAVLQRLPPRWFTWRTPVRKVVRVAATRLGVPTVRSYRAVVRDLLPRALPVDEVYPTAIPNWDNAPRSGAKGLTLHGSTPALFARHMRDALALVSRFSPGRRLVFVKSWNEWAEGNHLEPDLRFGHGYLAAIRDALDERAPAVRGRAAPSGAGA
jgi:lipopolysaccharide biosynthesis protein